MECSSQEIQLLTQVLPNIAAQFRTALGNMQAALKTGDDPDSCILRQSYYRLLRIVTNLTDAYMLTEEEPLPKQDTELVEFFDDLCRQAQVPLELCGLTLRADLRPRHLTAGIHREYTTRIFWNLISNAAKFTPAGGEIRVTLIAPELQDTVYDRILHTERMDPLPHGLGLGLPLSRCFARRQGGNLLLHSEAGKGTVVTVALPVQHCGASSVQDIPFQYAGGFQPVMMELADALSHKCYLEKYLD